MNFIKKGKEELIKSFAFFKILVEPLYTLKLRRDIFFFPLQNAGYIFK